MAHENEGLFSRLRGRLSGKSGQDADSTIASKDRVKVWKDRIAKAKKLRSDWETEFKLKELENMYLGKETEGIRVFNHFLATLKSELPPIFFTNPTFMVRAKPKSAGPAATGQLMRAEGVLQSIAVHDDNLEESGELAIAQSYFRLGVLKVIFDPKLEPNPRAGKPVFMHNADQTPILDRQTGQPQLLLDPDSGQPVMEPNFIVSDEVYRWEWIDARKMLLPDQGPDQRKWTWIGEEVITSLEEARTDERFPQELRERLKSNYSADPDREKNSTRYETEQDHDEMICYSECYDIKRKQWYIYAEGQDFEDFLVEGALPDGIEDHPYAILSAFNPIFGPKPSPWPLPEVFAWKPVQEEYNIRRTQITAGAGRSARKYYYDESTFDNEEEAKKALVSTRDMEGVKITSIKNPPVILTDPGQTPDLYKDIQLLTEDKRQITGQTGAKLGLPNASSATEATFAERASDSRTADKRKMVNRWMRKAGRKMLQLVQGTMTLDMYVMIRGLNNMEVEDYAMQVYGLNPLMLRMLSGIKDILIERLGKQDWVKTTRSELIFEADVEVVPGSVRPRTLDVERQEWFEFLKVIGAFPQLLLSRELLMETARKYETITQAMVDELNALAQKMMMAQQTTAGRQGDNQQGGGPGPNPIENTLTALMQGGGTPQ